jgi:hypothetical protein
VYEWLFCESSWPHAVVPAIADGELAMCGAALWQQAVNRWDYALHNDSWPGYVAPGAMLTVSASPWVLAQALGEQADG